VQQYVVDAGKRLADGEVRAGDVRAVVAEQNEHSVVRYE
jgi:hypothetical protein